ncbi:hypothetical protein HU200_004421 [Digitaria exilis]|uniref:Beta-glucosidase n=1 Tax=Digitaria exilis TaxID=1010633 RepID=A0A835KXG2_9POAL|nr:hypothetical protein HU200_004421 [Digitaria exilis]
MASFHKITLLVLMLCMVALGRAEYAKYKDPKQPLAARIHDLLGRMTLAEKIGQMTQIERADATPDTLANHFIGSVFSAGGSVPAAPRDSAETWASMVNEKQKAALSTRLGIPIIYGTDANHGNCYAYKATIFPHNIGLGATRQYVGAGGTFMGMDQNNTVIDAHGLLSIHMAPYYNAIIRGVSTVMISYSSWNGVKTHANHFLITDFLKNRLKFREHRDLAREAVRKSMVLLKNGKSAHTPLLPLPKKVGKILVAGSHADNLGYQCGGWTMSWQGESGNNFTAGTTILSAIKGTVDPATQVIYSENPDAGVVAGDKYDYAIVAVGEAPYAEELGDNLNLTIPAPGESVIQSVCKVTKCVVVLVSGRPLVVEPYLSDMDALVAAWLPGTEGQGVADVLFGDYGFTGKLPLTWFRSVEQLPMNVGDAHYDPLFPFGFGLTTTGTK